MKTERQHFLETTLEDQFDSGPPSQLQKRLPSSPYLSHFVDPWEVAGVVEDLVEALDE